MRTRRDLALIAVSLLALGACRSGDEGRAPAGHSSALGALEPAPATPVVIPDLAGGQLLDVSGTRLLVGDPEPAPPNADPALRMSVRLFTDATQVPWPLEGASLGHARFLPGGGILAIAANEELLEVDPGTGSVRRLDEHVVGPVGASLDGRFLVYCKGEMADTEVWLLDRQGAGSSPRALTRGMAPAWSPAISPDGRTVVFASSRSGVAALWRTDGGEPRQLTSRDVRVVPGTPPEIDPFPASITPTLFDGHHIVFEGQGGVAVLDAEGRPVRWVDGASVPHWRGPNEVGVVSGGRIEVLDLGEGVP